MQDEIPDDRDIIKPGDRVLLIVEDDVNFASILLDMARAKGFKGLVALRGDIGLALARERQPDAITLDLQLPLVDGWTVLDQLKRDPATRHIPIQVISVMDRNHGSIVGAISYLEKPVSSEALDGAFTHMTSFIDRDVKNLLIVEDDEIQRDSMTELIGNMDVKTTAVATGEDALAQLKANDFDCMVLDLGLPDMAGVELLKKVKRQARFKNLPVVIYTSRDLTRQEEAQLKKYAETIITKDARSPERLLDETALFLHRIVAKLPEAKRKVVEQAPGRQARQGETANGNNGAANGTAGSKNSRKPQSAPPPDSTIADSTAADGAATTGAAGDTEDVLSGRCVLLVDDDVRNVFALTSVLENYGVEVVFAENGRDALEILQGQPSVDLILMDVMMPEMDGYETTRAIRQMERYADLPIISLTAKAMSGDRERSLEAGASDYITKPVDLDLLLASMRKLLARTD